MKNIFSIILLLFTSCVTLFSQNEGMQQNKERMEQKEKTTELNYFKNPRYKNKPEEFIAKDGNYIYNDSDFVYEFTPPEKFYIIQKFYYEDGALESITYCSYFSLYTEEYDNDGFLIEKNDFKSMLENRKLDGMDYETFFENEGWYNRSTGQTAFREEPYPLNTGEFTEKVFQCITTISNKSTIRVKIKDIKKIPQQFLDKYGTVGEDGVKYLERRNNNSEWARLEVFYIIDTQTNTYKVDWGYILSIE